MSAVSIINAMDLIKNLDENFEDCSTDLEEEGSHCSSSNSSQLTLEKWRQDVEASLALPSIGSARHAAGGCRPCAFIGRTQCLAGNDCVYCHYPHGDQVGAKETKQKRRSKTRFQSSRAMVADTTDGPETAPAAGHRAAGKEWLISL